MSKIINLGIIGTGRVAERHAIALKKIAHVNLYSVASRKKENATLFIEKHAFNAKAYDQFESMLEDPNLHAVLIATPDNLHAAQIIAAAKSGKAILVEKPLCTSLIAGQEILTTLAKYPTLLTVGYHLRWHQGFRWLAKKAQNNELGEIHHLQFRWGIHFIDHAKWRLDPTRGGWCCLSTLGTHLIDLTRWIMLPTCGELIKQTSKINYQANTTIDETVSMQLQFESGATADLFCSVVVDEPLSLKIKAHAVTVEGDHLAGATEARRLGINNEKVIFTETNLQVCQLRAFMDSVLNGTEVEVSVEEGLKNVEVLVGLSGDSVSRICG